MFDITSIRIISNINFRYSIFIFGKKKKNRKSSRGDKIDRKKIEIYFILKWTNYWDVSFVSIIRTKRRTPRFRNSIEQRRRYNTCIETWRITNRKIALFVFRWHEKIPTDIILRLSVPFIFHWIFLNFNIYIDKFFSPSLKFIPRFI